MQFRSLATAVLMAYGAWCSMAAAEVPQDSPPGAPPEAIAKWRQMKFGMFIHWGPVSLKGTEIGWSRGKQVPVEEYDRLYLKFNPQEFDAEQWVKTAKNAGMKYIVFTSKHHDGFCMFDTKQTDYSIIHSPFARDVVKELAEACRKEGLAFGTYYSVCDWYHPDFPLGSPGGKTEKPNPNLDRYEQYLCRQVEELIRHYGPLLTMWFDYPQKFDAERGRRVHNFVRSLQPDILINDRCGLPGDYATPEQKIGAMSADRPWETCLTLCQQWAWKPDDEMKSFAECVRILVNVVGGDGNLLLNVGPMPDGRIEPRQAERLAQIGQWLERYGESIYGTRGGPFPRESWGASTQKDNTIYLHVLDRTLDQLQLPPLKRKIADCSVLTGGTATVKQTAEAVEVVLPNVKDRQADTIVALQLAPEEQ